MMEEEVKVEQSLVNTCHGCLSYDRRTTLVGAHSDMLLNLLGVHKQCLIYSVEDIRLCWECTAILKKFKTFQDNIQKAQASLMKILYELDTTAATLSKLGTVKKYHYDHDITYFPKAIVKKNNEALENITIVKTEFEDLHSYDDDDDDSQMAIINDRDYKNDKTDTKIADLDSKVVAFDSKIVAVDSKVAAFDSKVAAFDSKIVATDSNTDTVENKPNDTINKDESPNEDAYIDFTYDIKTETLPEGKVKKPRRRKDTKCVNNVVGYYKKYATLVKTVKKDWGSLEKVRSYFKKVLFTEQKMEDHFFIKDRRNTSYQRMAHKCDICTLGYTKGEDLKRHNDLNHHKEGAPYKCSLCSKKQSSSEELEKHWRIHSVVFQCNLCADVCKENFMRKHLDHAHTKTYDCNICHAKFKTLKSFTIHYKQMHMTYVCDYCNHTLTTKTKMEKHISEHHMTYTCKDCNRQYKNYIYYKKHCYALHPDKIKQSINPELSFCVECNKQFPSVDKYKTHLRVSPKHNKKKSVSLPCPDCGKMFGRKKNLTYHYNLFHLKKTQFYCEICDKYFARPSGLRTHTENVHLKVEKAKDKICDLCGRGFTSHVVLRHHRRTHTGERPHKCPHCSAEFIQKYAMQTHVRTQHKDYTRETHVQPPPKLPARPPWPDAAGYFA